MRTKKELEQEAKDMKFLKDALIIEILLDIRELLIKREARETLKQLKD